MIPINPLIVPVLDHKVNLRYFKQTVQYYSVVKTESLQLTLIADWILKMMVSKIGQKYSRQHVIEGRNTREFT